MRIAARVAAATTYRCSSCCASNRRCDAPGHANGRADCSMRIAARVAAATTHRCSSCCASNRRCDASGHANGRADCSKRIAARVAATTTHRCAGCCHHDASLLELLRQQPSLRCASTRQRPCRLLKSVSLRGLLPPRRIAARVAAATTHRCSSCCASNRRCDAARHAKGRADCSSCRGAHADSGDVLLAPPPAPYQPCRCRHSPRRR